MSKRSVYHREVPGTCANCGSHVEVTIDVYRVLRAYGVADQNVGHAIKKLLVPGKRSGGKSEEQDINEAIWTLNRWAEMRAEEARGEPSPPDGTGRGGR